MHFNFVFVSTALLASASMVISATITSFAGADCTGSVLTENIVGTDICLTLGNGSAKSISYSDVPDEVHFFISGGQHDSCTNGAQLVLGGGTGCATAPTG